MQTKAFALGAAFCALSTPSLAETFVIVHGAFQAVESWEATVDALTAAGDTAIAVNIPGRAGDGRALGEVQMADHVATVRRAVATAAAAGPDGEIVLAGRSFGGMAISAPAEAAPSLISGLVHVPAHLPRGGATAGDSRQELAASDDPGGWQAGNSAAGREGAATKPAPHGAGPYRGGLDAGLDPRLDAWPQMVGSPPPSRRPIPATRA